jgi:hypothetical protein
MTHFEEHLGFSCEISGGELKYFYRTSVLNRDFDDFAIPMDMLLETISKR